MGPAHTSRHRRTALRLIVLGGVAISAVALSSPAFAAVAPRITASKATFVIPGGSSSNFTLKLWSHGTMEGTDSGTTGTLLVAVPATASCSFQADVTVVPVGSTKPVFYSGARATVPNCGPPQTIAGDIFLCDATGAPTTTQAPDGSLNATGPETVSSSSSHLGTTHVLSGSYAMTAAAPTGYVFVACGGTSTVDSSGVTASESVTVPGHGAGYGTFYVVLAAPTGSLGGGGSPGGGSTSSGNGPPTSPGSSGQPTTPVANTRTAPNRVNSSHLAFTGMNTEPLLLVGLLMLAFGALATVGSRLRRRPAVVVESHGRAHPQHP
jgi:hypothetical protein